MIKAKIIGTGSYAPKKVVTNHDLAKTMDTNDEWITERTGIKQRHIADKNETTSDLALEASLRALKAAKLSPQELDLIIVATMSPDMVMPSTGCVLQEKLGAKNAAAFDMFAACSGFIYGLSVANAFIKSEIYKNVLVVGAEVLSRFTDWEDRSTCILFGDGAGAVVLRGPWANVVCCPRTCTPMDHSAISFPSLLAALSIHQPTKPYTSACISLR